MTEEEIPIWVDGKVQWLSGVDRRTTCKDVLELFAEGSGGCGDISGLSIVERWRQVERTLDLDSRLLKIWNHWGDEQKEVRLCLRRADHEADSGRGSPVMSSLKRKRNRARGQGKPPWNQQEGLHPRRLAELGGFNKDEYQDYALRRLQADEGGDYALGEKTYARTHEAHKKSKCCPSTGMLHSTAIEGRPKKCCSKKMSKPKVRNSENIEKLMKLILAQGATIQSQLQKLKEREQQIESIEVERHKLRVEKNGRNYLLETYLEGLKDAEVPATDEEKGNDSGVHTEAGSEQTSEKDKEKDSNSLRLRKLSNAGSSSRRTRDRRRDSDAENTIRRKPRSKSESRTVEPEERPSLQRTLSADSIATGLETENKAPAEENSNDIVELRRVQSQVEMWEKVLRINKKLEKEEENLVRLHIQIRRIQSENIKMTKDEKLPGDPEAISLQKQLELLRSDLDQNSKEIYRNFTQLIEEDEQVVKKQKRLKDIISDLDRTVQEQEMLEEMIASAATSTPLSQKENIGISLQVKGQVKISCQPDLIPSTPIASTSSLPVLRPVFTPTLEPPDCVPSTSNGHGASSSHVLPSSTPLPPLHLCTTSTSPLPPPLPTEPPPSITPPPLPTLDHQRRDSTKPKTVKITFDENLVDNEVAEKPKDPSPEPPRNIKGILKNRNSDTFYLGDLEKVPVDYGSNISSVASDSKISGKVTTIVEGPARSYPQNGFQNPIYGQTHTPMRLRADVTYGHIAPNVHFRNGTLFNHSPQASSQQFGRPNPDVYGIPSQYYSDTGGGNFASGPPTPSHHRIISSQPFPHVPSTEVFTKRSSAATPTGFPVVTTKAIVHNDTDSSGSSDTSGLSSMYSASPTVEEPTYIFNTLV